MDLLVKECANRCGLSPQRLKDLEEIYVNPTYGFQYKKNFERMLIAVVGFPVLETVENSIPTQVTTLKVLLGDLTKLRNHYAHTHFDETSPYPQGRLSIPTPSVMIANANIAAIGLDAIELQLKAAGY